MECKAWIEDGYVEPRFDARCEEMSTIRRAWDVASESRIAYTEGDFELANERLYKVFYVATEALVRHHGCIPVVEVDIKLAQRLSRDIFTERVVGPLFEKARTLGEMLPLEAPLGKEDDFVVRGSISAGIEYLEITESFIVASKWRRT